MKSEKGSVTLVVKYLSFFLMRSRGSLTVLICEERSEDRGEEQSDE